MRCKDIADLPSNMRLALTGERETSTGSRSLSSRTLSSSLTRRSALLAGTSFVVGSAAIAQSARPVRLIVPTSAGSSTDAMARALQPGLSAALGVPVVVEAIPGASGIIGLQALNRSASNNVPIALMTNSLVTAPSVMKSFPFDVTTDFTLIALVGTIPMVVAVNAGRVPATNASEFAALLKSRPDELTFGSSGHGSLSHLGSEMLLDEMGAKARHIPFNGPSPMATALIAGQIDFTTVGYSVLQQHIRSGVLRAIGACTAERTAIARDIPTFVEQGLPNYVADAWLVVLGPKGMDPALVTRLHSAVTAAVNDPATVAAVTTLGGVITLSTPEQARETIRRDLERYVSLVRKIGLEQV